MKINSEWAEYSYWSAGLNWTSWSRDFEFTGNPACLPVLAENARFDKFCREYSILRYYPDHRPWVRQTLSNAKLWKKALKNKDGSGIEALANYLAEERDGLGVQRSMCSKLAAFIDPTSFVPWDRFARNGVAKITNGPENGNYNNYVDYLEAVNEFSNGEQGRDISKFLKGKSSPTKKSTAFRLRVIDTYLMVAGRRWD